MMLGLLLARAGVDVLVEKRRLSPRLRGDDPPRRWK
jgi:hypothetical protein